jgi:mono/diheme cytochrome c family protein
MPALSANDIASGQALYAQHCAQCHGANLEGQPDWKKPLPNGKYPAPPHDDSGHTWHHGDALLLAITANGGDGTGDMSHGDMPAFRDKLSEGQMHAVLAFLKSRWAPEHREYQWRMTIQEAPAGNGR